MSEPAKGEVTDGAVGAPGEPGPETLTDAEATALALELERLEGLRKMVSKDRVPLIVIGVVLSLAVLASLGLAAWATSALGRFRDEVEGTRVASCQQFNAQQYEDANDAKDLVRDTFAGFPNFDPADPEVIAFFDGLDRRIDARVEDDLRDCTPEGIDAYLTTSTTAP